MRLLHEVSQETSHHQDSELAKKGDVCGQQLTDCFKIAILEESECIKLMIVIGMPMTPVFIHLLWFKHHTLTPEYDTILICQLKWVFLKS